MDFNNLCEGQKALLECNEEEFNQLIRLFYQFQYEVKTRTGLNNISFKVN